MRKFKLRKAKSVLKRSPGGNIYLFEENKEYTPKTLRDERWFEILSSGEDGLLIELGLTSDKPKLKKEKIKRIFNKDPKPKSKPKRFGAQEIDVISENAPSDNKKILNIIETAIDEPFVPFETYELSIDKILKKLKNILEQEKPTPENLRKVRKFAEEDPQGRITLLKKVEELLDAYKE